jgi:hypothetical protein
MDSRYQQPGEKADRQTYHRLSRWVIFSPFGWLSQESSEALKWIENIYG